MSNDMREKKNKRSESAKSAIQEALIQILEVKPLDRITISELSDAAGVNRKTFYAHYSKIEDVAVEIQNELSENVDLFLQYCMIDEYGMGPQFFIQLIHTLYSSNPVFFENLFVQRNYHFFAEHVRDALRQQLLHAMQTAGQDDVESEYLMEYILNGVSAIIIKWIREGKTVPFETVTDMMLRFITKQMPDSLPPDPPV